MSATLLSSRAVIRLSPQEPGEDVRQFLQGLVTNDVTAALPHARRRRRASCAPAQRQQGRQAKGQAQQQQPKA